MPAILVNLLILVLVLVLLQFLLDAVGLKDPAKNVIWVIAIIIGVIWLLGGRV
jgi:hypothetical protein